MAGGCWLSGCYDVKACPKWLKITNTFEQEVYVVIWAFCYLFESFVNCKVLYYLEQTYTWYSRIYYPLTEQAFRSFTYIWNIINNTVKIVCYTWHLLERLLSYNIVWKIQLKYPWVKYPWIMLFVSITDKAVLMCSVRHNIYFPSVCPGRGIPHLGRYLLSPVSL